MTMRRSRVGDVLELERSPIEVQATQTYRQVGVRGFGRGIFEYAEVSGSDLGKLRYFRLEPSRLVVSNIKGWEGAVAVTKASERGRIASNRFLTYAVKGAVDLDYAANWLLSEPGLDQLGRASPGSADRNRTLSIENFEAITMPLPDIDEQRRIAAHLDAIASTSRCAGMAAQDSARMHHTLVEGAIRKLAQEPRRPVGELLGRERSWFEPKNGERYAPIGVRGFGRGLVRYPEISRDELPKLRFYPVKPERMIVSNIKAWEGAVALTTLDDVGRVASNRFLQYRLIGNATTLPYLHQYLISRDGLAQMQVASPGSADRNRTLSMDSFEAILVPMPDVGIQRTFLKLVDKLAEIGKVGERRQAVAEALLPSARNEIFSAMR